MSRRRSSSLSHLLLGLLLAAGTGAFAPAAQAGDIDDSPTLEVIRHTIDDGEIKEPGDDDQPTVRPRRPAPIINTSGTAQADPADAQSRPASGVLRVWLDWMQTYFGRFAPFLR